MTLTGNPVEMKLTSDEKEPKQNQFLVAMQDEINFLDLLSKNNVNPIYQMVYKIQANSLARIMNRFEKGMIYDLKDGKITRNGN